MNEQSARSIVNFGGSLWWVFIRFCRTKLSDERKEEKSARNFIFLVFMCYLVAFIVVKMT